MNIRQNVSLKDYSTMRLGGDARYLGEANNIEELHEFINWGGRTGISYLVIGHGSNIVWQDGGYEGLVIVNKIKGFTVRQIGGTDSAMFSFGAGEDWDEAIRKTVDMGYTGIEKLSLIPGTVGGAPVQNIGAYGCEAKDTLVSVRAYDNQAQDFVTITNEQCKFGYRTSIFNTTSKGRYIIVSVTFKLSKDNPKPPFYPSLQKFLDQYHIKSFTPLIIRNAVIAVRSEKLPDPRYVANNGSFFGNPIVDKSILNQLLVNYKNIPNWPAPENKVKLSAGWLIEHAGFSKGYRDSETGVGLWKNHPLVIVNENAKSTSDLLRFRQKIIIAVKNKFGVTLTQEPELI
jgi:UDP-N-acetylmuramate dehydrogenase